MWCGNVDDIYKNQTLQKRLQKCKKRIQIVRRIDGCTVAILINLSQQVKEKTVGLGGIVMDNILQNIMIGFLNFPVFAVLLTVPIFAVQLLKYKTLNPVRILLNYAAILYGLCMFALVFLPIPTIEEAVHLSGHSIQMIPFHFVADIVRESPLVLTDIHTYLPAVFNRTVLQVVFNVIMTMPFGMLLRYYFGCSAKKVVLFSFLLSLFIEVAQLTGLFFMYSGSYRLCDMDDLIANTFGGFLGYMAVNACHFLPEIHKFDRLPKAKVVLAR